MQAEIISLLMNAGSYQHSVSHIEHIETHISHVFLTGEYAYKLKKPVKFDFLDFSTLEKRKFYCEEELRLNSRFASELYLDVIPISRSGNKIVFGPGQEILDYVIQMRQFDENSLFDQLEARGELRQPLLLQITDVISKFHLNATPQPEFWTSEYVAQTLKNNFDGCLQFCPEPLEATLLRLIRERTEEIFLTQKTLFRSVRKLM